jgi:UDP-N-acetylmuramoylalanine--D-glutamate ligase
VAVYGIGASGAASARYLVSLGAEVGLFDDTPPTPARLAELGLQGLAPPVPPGSFAGYELLVVSPGVPVAAGGRAVAAREGIPVIGELALGALGIEDRLLVVTGSHGKSTTTTWIAELLEARGVRAVACGNLGTPLSAARSREGADRIETFVVECSSFQLHDSPGLRVPAAVFTAYAVNHLDWHPDEAHYREAKLSVLDAMPKGAPVSYLPGFPGLEERIRARGLAARPVGPGSSWSFDEGRPGEVRTPKGTIDLGSLDPSGALALLAPAVALAAAAAAAGPAEIAAGARRFRPLPHRMEGLGAVKGRRFVNDSKATTPAAAAYSLSRVGPGAILILGGKDKGISFTPYKDGFARARCIVATGAARDRIARDLAGLPLVLVADFPAAVRRAYDLCEAGGTVLLAPGCSSFDAFRSFEERGERFRGVVAELSRETP